MPEFQCLEKPIEVRNRVRLEEQWMPGRERLMWHYAAVVAGDAGESSLAEPDLMKYLPRVVERWPRVFIGLPDPLEENDVRKEDSESAAKVFAGNPPISPHVAIEWAARNLYLSPSTADAPGDGLAWTLHKWAKKNDESRDRLMTHFVAKLIPSQREIDDSARKNKPDTALVDELDEIGDAAKKAEQILKEA